MIAATLEKNWEAALRRVRDCEGASRANNGQYSSGAGAAGPERDRRGSRSGLEEQLQRHQGDAASELVRALVNEIVVDIDEAAREIVLIIH